MSSLIIGNVPALEHPRSVSDHDLVTHVLRVASYVTDAEYQRGIEWYPRYSECIAYLADELGHERAGLCGVFALLSCNNTLSANVKVFRRYLDGAYNIHTGMITDRIRAVENHAHIASVLAHVDPLGSAPKLRRFTLNLYDPDFPAVTLDRWMFRLLGPDWTPSTAAARYGAETTTYHRIERAMIDVAGCHGIVPSALQAMLWELSRGSHD